MKYAFVLIHFGNNIKYFELELYFINMLKNNTKYDCIYMYSEIDTPLEWVNIMKNYFTKVISFNDDKITFNIPEFESNYKHFNTLRTCDYIFSYNLIEYKKICIIESDMIIMNNIDDIFENNIPATFFMKTLKNNKNINSNNAIIYDNKNNENCSLESPINGGILLFKPSKKKFKYAKNIIKEIILKKCKYPNEELFLNVENFFITENKFYNIPIMYNYSHYFLSNNYINFNKIKIVHFNESKYKYTDIVKNNYKNKFIEKQKVIQYFKNKYYNKLNKIINDILIKL